MTAFAIVLLGISVVLCADRIANAIDNLAKAVREQTAADSD